MADPFISDARDDRDPSRKLARRLARRLATALERAGDAIWRDAPPSAGDDLSTKIRQEIDAAQALIVIWTPSAPRARDVAAQAMRAEHNDKAISTRTAEVDPRNPPVPVPRLHCARITDLRAILRAVAAKQGAPSGAADRRVPPNLDRPPPPEAAPPPRRRVSHDGAQSGLFAVDERRGTLEDCELFDDALAGVAVQGRAEPMRRRGLPRGDRGAGVILFKTERGPLRDFDTLRDGREGVAVEKSGRPILRGARIEGGASRVIRILDNRRDAVVENCDPRGYAGGAWDVALGASVERKDTRA